MATIGRQDAVAQLPGGLKLTGPVGWVTWLALHLVMLTGFRNRANVLVNGAWNYVTHDRGSRMIVGGDDPVDPWARRFGCGVRVPRPGPAVAWAGAHSELRR